MQTFTPSPELYSRIISQIQYEHKLIKIKRKFILFASSVAISFSLFWFLLKDFSLQIQRSNFFELTKLLFSDFQTVLTHFTDYAISLAESMPILNFALLNLVLIFLIASVIEMFKYRFEINLLKKIT